MTDRQIKAEDIQSTFLNPKTFSNYLSVLRTVNKHYNWDPDVIYYDRLNDKAEQIAKFIFRKYKISNTAQYRQKVSAISSLMSRTGFGEYHKFRLMIKNADVLLSVADTSTDSDIIDWNVLQPQLAELGKEHTIRGIIARIFSYGYVLRVGEIFSTRIDLDNGQDNYLDLVNCKWYIRKQKNGTAKTFDVDPELCNSLKQQFKYIGMTWLLSKVDGAKYGVSCHRLPYHGWSLPSNTDIRKSYETWNRNKSDRTEEEQLKWHKILGHSRNVVDVHYNKPEPEPALEPIEIVPIKTKPLIKKKIKPTPLS